MAKAYLRTILHPTLRCLCREDGAVLVLSRNPHWTFGWNDEYLGVSIRNKNYRIHRLIADAFIGPCPPGCEVDHIDRNKHNNSVSNLRYVSRSENVRNTERVIYKKGCDLARRKQYLHQWYLDNRDRILAKRKNGGLS